MPKPFNFLILIMICFLVISCKNDPKKEQTISNTENVAERPPVKRAKKKDLTPEDIEMLNSVMARIMGEQELKKFASYTVTANLTDLLSNTKGPFTVFAPSNAALETLTPERQNFYSNPENKAKLEALLKSHIVEGHLNQETLMQTINKSGKAKLKTLEGITLTATKSVEDIIISDGKGVKAKVVKGSIEGSNGTVYVVDGVLNLN